MTVFTPLPSPPAPPLLRAELEERRARLEAAMRSTGSHGDAARLLAEVVTVDVSGKGVAASLGCVPRDGTVGR